MRLPQSPSLIMGSPLTCKKRMPRDSQSSDHDGASEGPSGPFFSPPWKRSERESVPPPSSPLPALQQEAPDSPGVAVSGDEGGQPWKLPPHPHAAVGGSASSYFGISSLFAGVLGRGLRKRESEGDSGAREGEVGRDVVLVEGDGIGERAGDVDDGDGDLDRSPRVCLCHH